MTAEPHLFIILGATGDLTARKLLPALHRLTTSGEADSVVLGAATTHMDDAAFRSQAVAALAAAGVEPADAAEWADGHVFYTAIPREPDYSALAARIAEIEAAHRLGGNRIFYLALPPVVFPGALEGLGRSGLATGPGWTRLVIEKPFGRDEASAAALNAAVHRHFEEPQVYRIDHYLGKESVQNLLVFRFTNPIFEAAWNRDRVARVEITVAEALDVAGRATYYDAAGAMRDMLQSHLTQLFTLVAMEAPSSMSADDVRAEKVKVLHSTRPIDARDVVIGQYTDGLTEEGPVANYLDHPGVTAESKTPTFAAVTLAVDTWRWQGVPFVLRTGKAMQSRVTEIAVTFLPPPVCLFHETVDECIAEADVLKMRLQPDEGFELDIEVKEPGSSGSLRTIPLGFRYADAFGDVPEAYETLLSDVMEGDQTLFVRNDWVEESWKLYGPMLDADLPLHPYPAGSWGPAEARRLIDGQAWATGN